MSHLNITTDRQLEDYCERLAGYDWIAFDTEFVSERTYRPVLCLIQVASEEGMAIIDPLEVNDVGPFWEAVVSPGHETIVHAGRGEMEFCLRATGRQPDNLFDVQIAAGMIGAEYPAGFGNLIFKLLGDSPRKGETRSDWRRRPLTDRQIEYALDDVRYLPPLRKVLGERLDKLDRYEWLTEEMTAWQEEVALSLGDDRWRRVSGNSGLDRKSLAVVRELWRWRESEAERRDCPVRHVLRDDLIIELSKRRTADPKRIGAVRGMDRGDLKRQLPSIAQSVNRALELPDDQWPEKAPRSRMPQLSVLGQFLFSALGSICRHQELAPALVGTPGDIRELIAYHTGHGPKGKLPQLAQGWRAEVVGQNFNDLLAGKLSLRIVDPKSDHPLVIEPAGDGKPSV